MKEFQSDPKQMLDLAERSLRNDLNQMKDILKNPSVTKEAEAEVKKAALPEESPLDAMEDYLRTQYYEGIRSCWEDFKSQYEDYCKKCPNSELERKVKQYELLVSMENAVHTLDRVSRQL